MFSAAFIGMGILLLILSRGRFGDQDRFFSNSYTVPGTVAELVEQHFLAGTSQRQPRIRFSTDEGLFEFDAPVRARAHGLWPERKVDVHLSQDFPGVAMLKLHQHQRAPAFILVGAVFIGIGLFNLPAMVDEVTDYPMLSLLMLAAVVATGAARVSAFRNFMASYYGLSDNIRPVSDADIRLSCSNSDVLTGEPETESLRQPRGIHTGPAGG
ncbi:hypothetical protein MLC59_13050 [Marinobacter bryozoorum]|uniref:hypothetical protein n=1 Tax=Marinobacter bryozoorum TaxID=256324 RepID=UPI002002B59C|nr:hypothetical protein [Marinobacter bryozoorum]MCK7545089.1 hypothetical protein [Marinobacter bryozoorum]